MTSITRQQADHAVTNYLEQFEVATLDFESPLPRHDSSRRQKLVVVRVDEFDLGWVYFYDSPAHVQSGRNADAIAGNAPIIVDRADGRLYTTGTAQSVEHYLQEFRMGHRTPI